MCPRPRLIGCLLDLHIFVRGKFGLFVVYAVTPLWATVGIFLYLFTEKHWVFTLIFSAQMAFFAGCSFTMYSEVGDCSDVGGGIFRIWHLDRAVVTCVSVAFLSSVFCGGYGGGSGVWGMVTSVCVLL